METWGQRDTAGVKEKKSKRKAVNLSALSLRDELLAEKKNKTKLCSCSYGLYQLDRC